MNDSRDSVPDSKRSRLRATIAAIERELARLPRRRHERRAARRRRTACGRRSPILCGQLALGPEPAYQQCPLCDRVGMRVATVCGHCWTKLTPTAAPGVVE